MIETLLYIVVVLTAIANVLLLLLLKRKPNCELSPSMSHMVHLAFLEHMGVGRGHHG
jgi:hypothetical protein